MTDIRPIVLGLADDDHAALKFAVAEAIRLDAPLHIVHAYGVPAGATPYYVGSDIVQKIHDEGQALLTAAQSEIESALVFPRVEYVLSSNTALPTLLEHAAEARLLVLGARRDVGLERLLGATVAEPLARKAACPVVVVPPSRVAGEERSGEGPVVIALDGETSAVGPLTFAFERAEDLGRELRVVHATPPATAVRDLEAVQRSVSEVLAGWSERYPSVHVDIEFTVGEPQEAVVGVTDDAAMLVLGRPHGHTLPFSRTLADRVVRHINGPVAIVPATYVGRSGQRQEAEAAR